MTRRSIGRRLDRLVVRLALITVFAGLVAAAAGVYLVWSQARTAVSAEISVRNTAVAEALAVRLDTRIEGIEGNLRLAATIPSVTAIDAGATPDLRAVIASSPVLDELVLYDPSGRAVAAAATRFLADPSQFEPRPDLARLGADSVHVDVIDGFPPTLEVAVPIESPPGRVGGALLAKAPLELVASHIGQPDPGTEAIAFLVGLDGRYLVHPSRDLVARGERFPAAWISTGGAHEEALEIGGRRWMVAVAPTLRMPGAVVLQRSEAEALGSVRRRLTELSLTVVAVIAATVAGVTVAGRRQLRPLDHVSDAVGRLERGERGVRVHAEAPGEIGALIRQLNAMAAALDRRVEEVTQLHHLSLLVSSQADRRQVGAALVDGAHRLLEANSSVFLAAYQGGVLRVEAMTGDGGDSPSLARLARECAGAGQPRLETTEEAEHRLALPLLGMEDEIQGILAVSRSPEPYTEDELRLAETFSSFAGVALENVRRLEYEQALVSEMEGAIELRRDLMGRVSHDLRVPVICIERFGSRLHQEWKQLDEAEREDLITSILEQAALLDDLVSKLLEYSVPLRSRRPVSLAPMGLRPVVAAALEGAAAMSGDRPIEVEIEEVDVIADSALLTRALTHLLANAIRHSPAGSPVQVRARVEGGVALIEVGDEGPGLDPDQVERAFEPFWRKVVEGHDHGDEGLGLGLTLAAEYARSMGGSIDARSEPGRGSVFTLRLPVAAQEGVRLRT